VVAGEDHCNGFLVRVVLEGVTLVVYAGQLEGDRLVAKLQVGKVSAPLSQRLHRMGDDL